MFGKGPVPPPQDVWSNRVPECFLSPVCVPTSLGSEADVITEPGDRPIYPFDAEAVARAAVTVAIKANPSDPETNLFRTCWVSL